MYHIQDYVQEVLVKPNLYPSIKDALVRQSPQSAQAFYTELERAIRERRAETNGVPSQPELEAVLTLAIFDAADDGD